MKKVILSLCLIFLYSCKEEEPFLAFEGDWSGSYSNDDFSGEIIFTVDDRGVLVGFIEADSTGSFEYALEGSVSREGSFRAVATLPQDSIEYLGDMEQETAEGTWILEQGMADGVWSANKE